MVDTVDYKKLADKILEISNLPNEEIDRIRKNAIQTSTKFTIESTINKLEEEYSKIV